MKNTISLSNFEINQIFNESKKSHTSSIEKFEKIVNKMISGSSHKDDRIFLYKC